MGLQMIDLSVSKTLWPKLMYKPGPGRTRKKDGVLPAPILHIVNRTGRTIKMAKGYEAGVQFYLAECGGFLRIVKEEMGVAGEIPARYRLCEGCGDHQTFVTAMREQIDKRAIWHDLPLTDRVRAAVKQNANATMLLTLYDLQPIVSGSLPPMGTPQSPKPRLEMEIDHDQAAIRFRYRGRNFIIREDKPA